jgi:hypothetical protein
MLGSPGGAHESSISTIHEKRASAKMITEIVVMPSLAALLVMSPRGDSDSLSDWDFRDFRAMDRRHVNQTFTAVDITAPRNNDRTRAFSGTASKRPSHTTQVITESPTTE